MNLKDFKTLQEAVKIFRKEFRWAFDKKSPGRHLCKEFGYACHSCLIARTVEEFDSFVNLYLDKPEK